MKFISIAIASMSMIYAQTERKHGKYYVLIHIRELWYYTDIQLAFEYFERSK